YPVFSWRWLAGRSLLFCSLVLVATALIGVAVALAMQSVRVGVQVWGAQFVAFSLMAMLGPALATWVRHRGWPGPRERWGVVVAVLLGMVLSYGVDHVASGYINELVKPRLASLGTTPPKVELGTVARALLLAVNLAVIYGLFGGGLALRAYFSERRRW